MDYPIRDLKHYPRDNNNLFQCFFCKMHAFAIPRQYWYIPHCMKFIFKLIYVPVGEETLSNLLQSHNEIIQIKELYIENDKHIALCSSKSLAASLKISNEIAAEMEIISFNRYPNLK